jgi:hypothetical protein
MAPTTPPVSPMAAWDRAVAVYNDGNRFREAAELFAVTPAGDPDNLEARPQPASAVWYVADYDGTHQAPTERFLQEPAYGYVPDRWRAGSTCDL